MGSEPFKISLKALWPVRLEIISDALARLQSLELRQAREPAAIDVAHGLVRLVCCGRAANERPTCTG